MIWRLQRQQKSRQVLETGWWAVSHFLCKIEFPQELFGLRRLALFRLIKSELHSTQWVNPKTLKAWDIRNTEKSKQQIFSQCFNRQLHAMTEEAYMITNLNSVWQGEAIKSRYCVQYLKPREITGLDEKMIFIKIYHFGNVNNL